MEKSKVCLIILDGWGHGPDPKASAIAQAPTPFVDQLYLQYPNSELITYGEDVGLPEGQMGNSEVGHLNIGAGRVVYQELARINKAIKEQTLHQAPKLITALSNAKIQQKTLHLMGLVSDGGVHSHINHLKALCDIAEKHGPDQIFIHAFTDGRDVDPKSGLGFIRDLNQYLTGKKAKIASIIGRYYAMDRDKRWERIKLAYDLLVKGKGTPCRNFEAAIQAQYEEGTTDEFLQALVAVDEQGQALSQIKDGDVLICFNFRTDRPRQISSVLTQSDYPEEDMHALDLQYLTMTRYDESFKGIEVLFEKDDLVDTLGEILAKAGKSQVRIAETEKYPHVTFFFSGGREAVFEGERRLLIPSPKVATYDLQPEMSAKAITEAIIEDIQNHQPDFICLNYANTDMVGHTGDFEAAQKAASFVDQCLQQLIQTNLQYGYDSIIIADHGNSDYMINEDGSPNTAHTKNPVPCFYVSSDSVGKQLKDGRLADVAPTILGIMGIAPPALMTGENLITSS